MWISFHRRPPFLGGKWKWSCVSWKKTGFYLCATKHKNDSATTHASFAGLTLGGDKAIWMGVLIGVFLLIAFSIALYRVFQWVDRSTYPHDTPEQQVNPWEPNLPLEYKLVRLLEVSPTTRGPDPVHTTVSRVTCRLFYGIRPRFLCWRLNFVLQELWGHTVSFYQDSNPSTCQTTPLSLFADGRSWRGSCRTGLWSSGAGCECSPAPRCQPPRRTQPPSPGSTRRTSSPCTGTGSRLHWCSPELFQQRDSSPPRTRVSLGTWCSQGCCPSLMSIRARLGSNCTQPCCPSPTCISQHTQNPCVSQSGQCLSLGRFQQSRCPTRCLQTPSLGTFLPTPSTRTT